MSTTPTTPQNTPQNKSPDLAALELMKPGPEHARLSQTIGTWKVACTCWMSGDTTPKKSTGTAKVTSIFDGRYAREEFSGEFDGKAYEGIGTMGYDRAAKQFVSTWYDNMGTGIIRTTGPAVTGNANLELRGEMICPMNGSTTLRQVYSYGTDDRHTLTMYNTNHGKENKTMEIVYTRER